MRLTKAKVFSNKTIRWIVLLIPGCIVFVFAVSFNKSTVTFHSEKQLHTYRMMADSLPDGFNGLFASSGVCDQCHGFDELGIASVDVEGADINVVDDWRSTMMANAAKDPFWRAKVSHEVLLNPGLQLEIENTCTRCHAPLGHFAAINNGQPSYSINEMIADSIALDGVSCLACHQQSEVGLGDHFSGDLNFVTSQTAFGPYGFPLVTPMVLESGYTPEYGAHISDAGICAGCHTLITETVDLEGNLTGDFFVEQATYHEWLNSVYSENNTTCQNCHMPQLQDQGVILAAGYDTPPRQPFGLHELTGANTLMLSILKNNIEALGITATEEQFDKTIASTFEQLQQKSVDVLVELVERTDEFVFVDVQLTNKAGHKLPSGYPSRKVSVQCKVTDNAENILFNSGSFDSSFYINNEDMPFEIHHDIIDSEDKVQVYEMIMGDITNNETTVLNRGYAALKDNRLPPLGYTTASAQYDTVKVVGEATSDPDFNHNPSEGSGTDVIHYQIDLANYFGELQVEVSVWYQSLPPTWMEEIFESSTDEIELFEAMFMEADRSPVLMNQSILSINEYVSTVEMDQISTPVATIGSGMLIFNSPSSGNVMLYDSAGRLVNKVALNEGPTNWNHSLGSGTYTAVFMVYLGKSTTQRLIITR